MGSCMVERSNIPSSAALARERTPASPIWPSTKLSSDPRVRHSSLLPSGASWGMYTCASNPPRAAYAAIAPAAFPAEGMISWVNPTSLALETAAAKPRALKVPVGFNPSSLMYKLGIPRDAPNREACSRGVPPSPNVMMSSGRDAGSNSEKAHMPACRPSMASRATSRFNRGRSYRASNTLLHAVQVRIGFSCGYSAPHTLHSRWSR